MTITTIETVAGPMVIDEEELQVGRFLDADGNIPTHDEVIAFMKRHVKEGDSVIDVGANAGFFTLVLAEIVGPEGHVTAYEPNYEVLKNLGLSINDRMLNHRIDAVMIAIGKERSWSMMRMDPRGPGGTQVITGSPSEGTTLVHPLDTAPFIRRPVSFIKIDTEGMDVDVLLGAREILGKDRPIIMFEWNPDAMHSLGKQPVVELVSLGKIERELKYALCDHRTDQRLWPHEDLTSGDYALIPDEKVGS